MNLASNECRKCKSIKIAEVHHCSKCKCCIYRMDHHCPWIDNCVGHLNIKPFLLFLFYAGLTTLTVSIIWWK
jgi:palmitoyltransferase